MLINKFALVTLLFLHIISSSDCRWHNAIEFWSSAVCSVENFKTVYFHGVLDNNGISTFLERYFQFFIYNIARKCETTIMSRIYIVYDSENTSFVDNNDVVHNVVKRPSIWKITSNEPLPLRVMPPTAEKIRIQNDKTCGDNTWNIHVILAGDIHSFDQFSKNVSMFEWNPQDRFIVLIASQEGYGLLNESNSRIDNILKTLWSKRKVQNILISESILVNDTTQINRFIRTYNPFAKVNNSVWGKIEIINVETVEEASNMLSQFIYRRTKNLNEYELKVGLFKEGQTIRQPKVQLTTHYPDFFKGFDDIILNTIAQQMNFKVKEIYPTDNKSFGYRLSNGTYIGAIAYTGDVVHGRTDICFVSFFVKKYSANTKEDIEFSTYVDFDRLCMVVPKSTKIPKGVRIYHFFPLSVWICSTLSHIFTYLTWYFLQVFSPGRRKKLSFRATIYRSFLLNAGCPQKLPNTNAERILLSGILLANVTLVGIFSGILYNSFAHDMYYPDIDSLHDFDITGLPISLVSFSLNDLFGSDNDIDSTPLMRNLRRKLRYGLNAINNAAYYRNVSGFYREHYFPIISEELIDTDGSPLLHLIKECPGNFYLSYLLPKNSILQERVNALIGQLNQAGLLLLWNKYTIQTFLVQKRLLVKEKKARKEKGVDGFVPFNLSDVQSSFYMLLIGLSVSTIVFFYEKGWLKASLSRKGIKLCEQIKQHRTPHWIQGIM